MELTAPKYVKSYVDRTGKQRTYYRHGRITVPLPPRAHPTFGNAYDAALRSDYLLQAVANETPAERRARRFKPALEAIFTSTKKRARAKGREFDLTLDWFKSQVEQQDYKCALTGLDFSHKRITETVRNPYAPSLDRLDNSSGYTKDNVRIILASLNIAINEWGEKHFETIVRAFLDGRDRT